MSIFFALFNIFNIFVPFFASKLFYMHFEDKEKENFRKANTHGDNSSIFHFSLTVWWVTQDVTDHSVCLYKMFKHSLSHFHTNSAPMINFKWIIWWILITSREKLFLRVTQISAKLVYHYCYWGVQGKSKCALNAVRSSLELNQTGWVFFLCSLLTLL